MRFIITYKLETSDHDGYCSGNECEYDVEEKTHVAELSNDPTYDTDFSQYTADDWIRYLPEPELNTCGSCFCDLSRKCESRRLDKHDFRFTIISVYQCTPVFIA